MRRALLLIAGLVCLLSLPTSAFCQLTASQEALGPRRVNTADYVYVSGQGPGRDDGSIPEKFPDQVRQTLDNVRKIVEAAGLTMDHVVYVQVYLEDIHRSGELDEAFLNYFPKEPPARAVLGVAKLPQPGVQIAAIAVRDLKGKQTVLVPGFGKANVFPGNADPRSVVCFDDARSRSQNWNVPHDPTLQVNLALDGVKSVLEAEGSVWPTWSS